MTKFALPIAVCLVSLACGKSPMAPTATPGAGRGATQAFMAPQVTGPHGEPPGCLEATKLPDVLEWRIDRVPLDAQIDKGYPHEENPGCGATNRDLRTNNDHLRTLREPNDPTTLIVRFDKHTYDCGHAQIDVSINGQNVIGEVLNYGKDCAPACPVPSRTISYGGTLTWVDPAHVRVDVEADYQNQDGSDWIVLRYQNGSDVRLKAGWPMIIGCDDGVRHMAESWLSYHPLHLPDAGATYQVCKGVGPFSQGMALSGCVAVP